ncbi:MAG: lysophospholipid acyltransferase family protein [Gemmatimonadota bacterium]
MRRLANVILKLVGWRMVGKTPRPQCLLIGAPHTSNWDFCLALLAFWSLEIDCHWLGKHTIFRRPFGGIMRRLGGIPLNRSTSHDFVPEVVGWFEKDPGLTLCIAPEGTRSRRDCWRSGFYWIAYGARVPIALGFFDYERRVGGIGEAIVPTGDIEADMEKIRAFYSKIRGRHPENMSPIRVQSRGDGVHPRSDGAPAG